MVREVQYHLKDVEQNRIGPLAQKVDAALTDYDKVAGWSGRLPSNMSTLRCVVSLWQVAYAQAHDS